MYGASLNQRSTAAMSEYAAKADGPPSVPMLVDIGARMSTLVDRIRKASGALEHINAGLAGGYGVEGNSAAKAPSPAGSLPQLLEMLSEAHSLMDGLENEAQRLSAITGG